MLLSPCIQQLTIQSEEDQQLKAELEMLVERLKESDTGLYQPALESLRSLIRTSTSSMTSVPKPLKFLRPHYDEMGSIRESWAENLSEQRVRSAAYPGFRVRCLTCFQLRVHREYVY